MQDDQKHRAWDWGDWGIFVRGALLVVVLPWLVVMDARAGHAWRAAALGVAFVAVGVLTARQVRARYRELRRDEDFRIFSLGLPPKGGSRQQPDNDG